MQRIITIACIPRCTRRLAYTRVHTYIYATKVLDPPTRRALRGHDGRYRYLRFYCRRRRWRRVCASPFSGSLSQPMPFSRRTAFLSIRRDRIIIWSPLRRAVVDSPFQTCALFSLSSIPVRELPTLNATEWRLFNFVFRVRPTGGINLK